jgi:hypothetical protein
MSLGAMTVDQQMNIRPPYIAFERMAVEDRAASEKTGRVINKDIDVVFVTPAGSKDRIPHLVEEWFKKLEAEARAIDARIPPAWVDGWRRAYQDWKNGQAVQLDGTPIKDWSVLTPAQRSNVVGANILTVEDLAQATDEGLKRIGPGAIELQRKAIAWLRPSDSDLQVKLAAQAKEIEELRARLGQLGGIPTIADPKQKR